MEGRQELVADQTHASERVAHRHPAPVRAEDEEVRADLFPARAELLVAFLRAAEHEAVAQQRVERLAERFTVRHHGVLAPRRVRLVLLVEIRPRHLDRGARLLRAEDLLEERKHLRERLPDARALLAI